MRIHFYCGPSYEAWNPKSLETGIGGSEAMVIGLAREFAKRGHKVSVWNRCLEEGVYDGVTYKNYDDFDVEETDVLIVWRAPQLLLKHHLDKVKAKKYLWLHDTIPQLDILPYTLSYDGIFCLSKWHRNYYIALVPEDLRFHYLETRNAVDYSLFDQKVERDPYTLVYGSLQNRGLVELLEMWPKIKLAVPQAKLRVFYGWKTLEKVMALAEFTKLKKQVEELMEQEGITHLGRISHREVAKEYLGAAIWAYPCLQFNEISCISAMQAQIGGAIPIIIPKAALAETVKYGVKITHGRSASEIYDKWSDAVIKVLKDQKGQQVMRKIMQQGVKDSFTFSGLAREWEGFFNEKS